MRIKRKKEKNYYARYTKKKEKEYACTSHRIAIFVCFISNVCIHNRIEWVVQDASESTINRHSILGKRVESEGGALKIEEI